MAIALDDTVVVHVYIYMTYTIYTIYICVCVCVLCCSSLSYLVVMYIRLLYTISYNKHS